MRIVMFFSSRIDFLPPLLTAAASMAGLGASVHVVASGSSRESADFLQRHGVDVLTVRGGEHPKTSFGRAVLRAQVGVGLVRHVRSLRPDCVWYHGPFAMEYGFLPGVARNAVIVAHAYELCDREMFLRHVMDTTLRRADIVIVPEINRLWMLRVRSGSPARFFEIPNRHLDEGVAGTEGALQTRQIFLENGGSDACSRFLIYQGAFMGGRCLPEVVEAFRGVKNDEVGLILLGGGLAGDLTQELRELARKDGRVVVVNRMPPPTHLAVTRGCTAGILLYAPLDLNNVFCAPNKVYEYAAAGLGMILPDYPGVALLGRTHGLGELCDPEDVQSIRTAMERVLTHDPKDYRRAAARFLQSTPKPEEMYRDVYEEICARIQKRRREGAGVKSTTD